MSSVREVAKRSGVSIATVSRVLNGDTLSVADETRERVLLAMRDLNYRVRPSARAARVTPTRNLAVIVPDLSTRLFSSEGNGYSSGVLDGVLETAARKGYSMILHVERLWTDRQAVIRGSFDGHCDGALFVGGYENTDSIRALWERGLPIVMVGTTPQMPGIASVDITNEATAARAVAFLVALGHRRIVYVGAHHELSSSRERGAGVRRGNLEADLHPGIIEYIAAASCGPTSRGKIDDGARPGLSSDGLRWQNLDWTEDAVERAFASPDRDTWPDAIIAWNVSVAHDLIDSLGRRGLRVPEDVSIVTFDDPEGARLTDPPLTTFAQPLYELGREAVELLLERVAHPGDPVRHVRLDPELVIRASVARRPPILPQ